MPIRPKNGWWIIQCTHFIEKKGSRNVVTKVIGLHKCFFNMEVVSSWSDQVCDRKKIMSIYWPLLDILLYIIIIFCYNPYFWPHLLDSCHFIKEHGLRWEFNSLSYHVQTLWFSKVKRFKIDNMEFMKEFTYLTKLIVSIKKLSKVQMQEWNEIGNLMRRLMALAACLISDSSKSAHLLGEYPSAWLSHAQSWFFGH